MKVVDDQKDEKKILRHFFKRKRYAIIALTVGVVFLVLGAVLSAISPMWIEAPVDILFAADSGLTGSAKWQVTISPFQKIFEVLFVGIGSGLCSGLLLSLYEHRRSEAMALANMKRNQICDWQSKCDELDNIHWLLKPYSSEFGFHVRDYPQFVSIQASRANAIYHSMLNDRTLIEYLNTIDEEKTRKFQDAQKCFEPFMKTAQEAYNDDAYDKDFVARVSEGYDSFYFEVNGVLNTLRSASLNPDGTLWTIAEMSKSK